MREKLFEILGVVVAIIGVLCIGFSFFQVYIVDTQTYLEYLVLDKEAGAFCLALGMGLIAAGLHTVHEAPFM